MGCWTMTPPSQKIFHSKKSIQGKMKVLSISGSFHTGKIFDHLVRYLTKFMPVTMTSFGQKPTKEVRKSSQSAPNQVIRFRLLFGALFDADSGGPNKRFRCAHRLITTFVVVDKNPLSLLQFSRKNSKDCFTPCSVFL